MKREREEGRRGGEGMWKGWKEGGEVYFNFKTQEFGVVSKLPRRDIKSSRGLSQFAFVFY